VGVSRVDVKESAPAWMVSSRPPAGDVGKVVRR
jgi:hypothetical protein